MCVFGVKLHAHVYKTNSQQLKETLVYMQVMTHLLSTCKVNCIYNVVDEGKQTSQLTSAFQTVLFLNLVTLIPGQEVIFNHVRHIVPKYKYSVSNLR